MLAACGGSEETPRASAPARPFQGAVIADEPRAALIGRDILIGGGSAADAAVATYFAMAVTQPSVATLGGGGVCTVYDGATNRAEVIDFVARAPRSRGIAAVPGNARGMYALSAKYGRLRWEQLLAPAEGLARFGVPVSRAFAQDIALGWGALLQDPVAFRIFGKPPADFAQRVARAARDRREAEALRAAFRPLGEGDELVQTDLANFISLLRRNGGMDLHDGEAAQLYAAATTRAQAPLTPADLAGVLPQFEAALAVSAEDLTLFAPPPPAAAGVMTAQIIALLGPQWRETPAAQRPNLLAQATLLAKWDRERWQRADGTSGVPPVQLVAGPRIAELQALLRPAGRIAPQSLTPTVRPRPLNPGMAKIVAVDRTGNVVTCGMTANGLFGLARIAPETGVVIAAASNANDNGTQWLSPIVVARRGGPALLGAVSSGGDVVPGVLAGALLTMVGERRPLSEVVAEPRMHFELGTNRMSVEQGGAALAGVLQGAGYTVAMVPQFGKISGFFCPSGAVGQAGRCEFVSDPRESGMAISAD